MLNLNNAIVYGLKYISIGIRIQNIVIQPTVGFRFISKPSSIKIFENKELLNTFKVVFLNAFH